VVDEDLAGFFEVVLPLLNERQRRAATEAMATQDGTEQIAKQLLDLVPVDHAAQRATSRRPDRRGKSKAKACTSGGGCRLLTHSDIGI
jgi:hypothetical protein